MLRVHAQEAVQVWCTILFMTGVTASAKNIAAAHRDALATCKHEPEIGMRENVHACPNAAGGSGSQVPIGARSQFLLRSAISTASLRMGLTRVWLRAASAGPIRQGFGASQHASRVHHSVHLKSITLVSKTVRRSRMSRSRSP